MKIKLKFANKFVEINGEELDFKFMILVILLILGT